LGVEPEVDADVKSRHAALVELEGGYVAAETGYENALWLLHVLLDDHFYDGGKIKDEDRVSVEKRKLDHTGPVPADMQSLYPSSSASKLSGRRWRSLSRLRHKPEITKKIHINTNKH
jgi:hypothetical protein